MNHCKYCNKEVKNKYCNQLCQNAYQREHKLEFPNIGKLTEESKKKYKDTIESHWKIFIVNCNICKKEIEIREFNVDIPKKERYFCSRTCANTYVSRLNREEKNKKISSSIINIINEGERPGFLKNVNIIKTISSPKILINKRCNECNHEFITTKECRNYCSLKCSRKHNIRLALIALKEKIKNNPEWQSSIAKKAYASGKNYVAGGTTKWFTYKNIKVQGTYELRICFILDKWKEIGKIKDWEYTKDKFPYIGIDNKKHSYLLDFKIFTIDNNFYYIEAKGYKKENDELKWKAVRDNGYKLEVWFNEDIINNERFLWCNSNIPNCQFGVSGA